MLAVISQMRIALLDVYQVTSVDCVAYMDFYTPYWLTTILTLLILVAAFGLHRLLPAIATACFPHMERDRIRDLRSLIVKYVFIFMYVNFNVCFLLFFGSSSCQVLSNDLFFFSVEFAARSFIRPSASRAYRFGIVHKSAQIIT
jgi:hypothetical protein